MTVGGADFLNRWGYLVFKGRYFKVKCGRILVAFYWHTELLWIENDHTEMWKCLLYILEHMGVELAGFSQGGMLNIPTSNMHPQASSISERNMHT